MVEYLLPVSILLCNYFFWHRVKGWWPFCCCTLCAELKSAHFSLQKRLIILLPNSFLLLLLFSPRPHTQISKMKYNFFFQINIIHDHVGAIFRINIKLKTSRHFLWNDTGWNQSDPILNFKRKKRGETVDDSKFVSTWESVHKSSVIFLSNLISCNNLTNHKLSTFPPRFYAYFSTSIFKLHILSPCYN